jgi:hypothetical protein
LQLVRDSAPAPAAPRVARQAVLLAALEEAEAVEVAVAVAVAVAVVAVVVVVELLLPVP